MIIPPDGTNPPAPDGSVRVFPEARVMPEVLTVATKAPEAVSPNEFAPIR
jgi:hypothetical protein